MARRIQYKREHGRFIVEDDTIRTWRIKDTLTGKVVKDGMEHYEASLEADRLNADPSEVDDAADAT